MNINISRAKKLYDKGFTYRFYQDNPHVGMVFYYNGNERILRGDDNGELTENDLEIVKNGIWLPSSIHLMYWLMENEFSFEIIHNSTFHMGVNNMGTTVYCKDVITGTEFSPTTECLACLIIKILKKAERSFDTGERDYIHPGYLRR